MIERPRTSDAEVPDLALVERLRAGDRNAAYELHRRYSRYVERLVERTFGADHEVPDVVTEVFARVLEQARTLTDPAAFKAWLGNLTLSTARSLLRTRRTRRKLVGLPAPDELPDVPVARNPLEARRALQEAQSAIACLTSEERTVYLLRVVEGMELTRVAATLGVSVGVVKQRLATARQALERAAQNDRQLLERTRGRSAGT